jgi:hypothetical protein
MIKASFDRIRCVEGSAFLLTIRVAKRRHLRTEQFWHTVPMTTKTIPEYLEDERRKLAEAQIRLEEEAAHIEASHPAHRRTAKQPKIESRRQSKAAVKTKKTGARKKTRVTKKAAMKARKRGK